MQIWTLRFVTIQAVTIGPILEYK